MDGGVSDTSKAFLNSASEVARKTKTAKVIRFFPNSDLRCMHDGLKAMAMENGIDPNHLKPGEFLVFCNTSRTLLKIFAPGNTIACTKSPDGRRLDLNVIRYIPRFFNGTEFAYNDALKEVLTKTAISG